MPPTPLFDTYVMVDWSAARVPRTGADSIWIGRARRGNPRLTFENPPTRLEARERLKDLLAAELAQGRRSLVGFDFSFGYPEGFAAKLGLAAPPWRAIWTMLAQSLEEGPDNSNNRYLLAAELNRRLSGAEGPFWGCARGAGGPTLGATHHRRFEAIGLAERRLADRRVGTAQPVWKLAGVGAVGSQTLTGLPVLHWLRHHRTLQAATRVWPFETGLKRPPKEAGIILAETYLSLVKVTPNPGEVKDRAQVRAHARHFATLDAAGRLAPLFAGDPSLTQEEIACIESEEGWTLGVTAPARSYHYLRDPRAIYRRSFSLIRAEIDVTSFPPPLRSVVTRIVHAAGEPELAQSLRWSEDAAMIGRAAIAAGAPILVDSKMVAAGVSGAHRVLCLLADRRVADLARKIGTTRSAAAVELWRPHLAGAVVAIGNAPTALFHLLEMIERGASPPALILGFPVGFVGAAESKAALIGNRLGLPFIALQGRRGGSALAAAAINALA
ncbi:MAG TPA: precorrin-8X methylmutase, partial [Stellaceae bacterium]|nr:precorrin-8X methylmutase [Stellaceae bacterium]